jgi:ergothioneine biosynthesis protein EgtB
LRAAYESVRSFTEQLAAPLSPEDQTVQSMPDVSPTKWHRGHTSWFFETFLLRPELAGYRVAHPAYAYIFNSYYEAAGDRYPRAERGLVSRPGTIEVAEYRRHVDAAMAQLLDQALSPESLDLVELGLNHEQQHQELLLMDIKHVLSRSPLEPAYASTAACVASPDPEKPQWVEHPGGPVEIGHRGGGFSFDNESPRHVVQLVPHAIGDRLVTCGDWQEFIEDGGYQRPELWLSEGWASAQAQGWHAPLYWDDTGVFTLFGRRPVDPAAPVVHVSYFEADAFARWSGARLPTEAEWETFAAGIHRSREDLAPEQHALHPDATAGAQLFGAVWQWTSSSYSPYPGFRTAPGAVGEYNGKFMVNQQVLRGSACITPPAHSRLTYRNFFPASARWVFAGLRLARDL